MRFLVLFLVLFVVSPASRTRAQEPPFWLEEVPAKRLSYVRRLRHFDGLAVSFGGDAQGHRMVCARSSPTLRTCHAQGFGLRAPGLVAVTLGVLAFGGGVALSVMGAHAGEGSAEPSQERALYVGGGIVSIVGGLALTGYGARHIARHRRGIAWLHRRHATLVPTADAASGEGGASLALTF